MRLLAVALLAAALPGCPGNEAPKPEAKPAVAANAGVCTASGECAGNCSSGCNCESTKPAETPVVPASQAKVGDLTRCPVSRGVFKVDDQTIFVEHSGKRLPVCCPGCKTRFQSDPSKFAGT